MLQIWDIPSEMSMTESIFGLEIKIRFQIRADIAENIEKTF